MAAVSPEVRPARRTCAPGHGTSSTRARRHKKADFLAARAVAEGVSCRGDTRLKRVAPLAHVELARRLVVRVLELCRQVQLLLHYTSVEKGKATLDTVRASDVLILGMTACTSGQSKIRGHRGTTLHQGVWLKPKGQTGRRAVSSVLDWPLTFARNARCEPP